MSEGPLPIATVTIGVGDITTNMRVLVKQGLGEVLLGQDYPELKQLLAKGIADFTPLTGILGPVEDAKSENEVTTAKSTGTQCLAEEAEDVGVFGDDGRIMAVQTRAQQRRERQQQQADDTASACSGAMPQPLPARVTIHGGRA